MLDKLNKEINSALRDPSIAEKLIVQGIVPQPMSVAEFTKFVTSESDKFRRVAIAADIKVEN